MLIRHVLALLLLIVAPLIAISWVGVSMLSRSRQQQDEQLRSILTERLVQIDRDLGQVASNYEETIGRSLRQGSRDFASLRRIRSGLPVVRETLLVDRDGGLVYPLRPREADTQALVWYSAMTELARMRPVGQAEDSDTSPVPVVQSRRRGSAGTKADKVKGTAQRSAPLRWQTWYHEGGLQLVLWQPSTDGVATGVVLERGRWMADLIAALPDQSDVPGQYSLRDSQDDTVYRWGQDVGDAVTDDPLATVRLASPWSAWTLNFADEKRVGEDWATGGTLALLASLVAIGVAVALLGAYVLTSLRRQMNLASQRVSFASHVSHELRTPLTNIRLYAELAKRDLETSDDPVLASKAAGRLDVIEEECRRLSRIVSGVLDMVSGKEKSRLRVQTRSPDAVVRSVLQGFTPAFENLGMNVVTELAAGDAVELDEDVIDLVLVNLLSNVEKYAGQGGRLDIVSRQSVSQTTIDVIDHGPGIKRSAAKKIFEPFARLDDSLSAPAGTGLGLAIARGAAERHGGDLVLIPSTSGAHFRFTLAHQRTAPPRSGGTPA